MHRTVFLINTNSKEFEGYPRVYYGNGCRRIAKDTVFEEVRHLETLEEFEQAIRILGLCIQSTMKVDFLWEVEEFVEIFFDMKNENPTYRVLSSPDDMMDAADKRAGDLLWHHKVRGFTDIWFAGPGPEGVEKGCWFAGIWTGPQQDLICVKKCETNEEAEQWLSPGADGPLAAIEASLQLLEDKEEKE